MWIVRPEELTLRTGLDFSAMDFKSSMAALVATEVREASWAGVKAAAEATRVARMADFIFDECFEPPI